jgi:hypothetical protein
MAGDEGFEPPILGPEPSALPLGQSPSDLYQCRYLCMYHYKARLYLTVYILGNYLSLVRALSLNDLYKSA